MLKRMELFMSSVAIHMQWNTKDGLPNSKVPYSGFFSRAINFVNFANDNHFAKINSSNFINFR